MLCVFIYTHLFILVVYDRCWRYLYLLTLVFVALFELALLGYLGIFATELLISPFTLPVITLLYQLTVRTWMIDNLSLFGNVPSFVLLKQNGAPCVGSLTVPTIALLNKQFNLNCIHTVISRCQKNVADAVCNDSDTSDGMTVCGTNVSCLL
jgi:hypothetical protein